MTTATSTLTAFRRALAVAGACAALTIATAASAAPPSTDAQSVTVRYDDLNLSTPAGVHALYRRISTAAREVCPDVYSHDLDVAAAAERCEASAIASAVSRVNNPQLALLHAAHASHG